MAERDINVAELADMTGLSRHTITRIRTGIVKRPTYDTAHLIAQALNVKVNSIWTDY